MVAVLGRISPNLLKPLNMLDLSTHLAESGLIAIGMTFVIMTGGIDLSVGSLLGMCGIVFGYTFKAWGLPAGIIAGLLTGIVGGSLNGFLISVWRLPALVVTLATMALFRGVAMVISQAQPVTHFPDVFTWLGSGTVGAIPVQLIIWLVAVVIGAIVCDRMIAGRRTVAIGDNMVAAHYAALPEKRLLFTWYVVTGILCAMAALIFTARVSTAKADAGTGLELEVITAVVLGGTAITGGRGTVIGSFLGVLILGFLRYGLDFAHVRSVYQTIIAGSLLILVSMLNQWLLARGSRRKKIVTTESKESGPALPAGSTT
jgi:rhamnose transport system permease protein